MIIRNDLLHQISFFNTGFMNTEGKALNYFPELFETANPVPVLFWGLFT